MSDLFEINNINYGLTNPRLYEDLGQMNLNRMISPTGFGGIYGGVPISTGLTGQLPCDRYQAQSQKEKDKETWKTGIAVAALAGGGIFAYKYGKIGAKKLWNGIKTLGTTIKSKFVKP